MSTYGFTVNDLIENSRINRNDINLLKTWLTTQKLPQFSDELLAVIHMASDNILDSTKLCLQHYYTSRKGTPQLFRDRNIDSPEVQRQFQVLNYCVMPERTDEGYVVILHRLIITDYSQYMMDVAYKVLFMMIDSTLYDDPPTGIITLFDMHGVNIKHLTRIHLSTLHKMVHYLRYGFPLKMVSMHIFNTAAFIDQILKLVRPFIAPEILNMVFFHRSNVNMEDFYRNHVPKKYLPSDYGGELKSVQEIHKDTHERMIQLKEFLLNDEIN